MTQKTRPLIPWPCQTELHWFTLRAAYYRIHCYFQGFLITVGFVLCSVTALFVYLNNKNFDSRVHLIVQVSLAATYLLMMATHVFPVWRSAFLGSLKTRKWRAMWRKAEADSLAFREALNATNPPPNIDDLYRQLPSLPPLSWNFNDTTDAVLRTIQVNSSSEADLNLNRRRVLVLAATELARLDNRCVCGRFTYDGNDTIVAIYNPDTRVQFWALFQVPAVGNVLSFRFVTGYQWWSVRGNLTTGHSYTGDVFRTKARECSVMLAGYLRGIFLFPLFPLFALFYSLRQVVRPDVRKKLLRYTALDKGDSVDLMLINSRRAWYQHGYGVVLLTDSLTAIRTLKQTVWLKMQNVHL